MPGLVLPEQITIHLLLEDRTPFRVSEVMLLVDTAQCRKNNYHLGPFFSDADGIVRITRSMLEREVRDELETGVMDYGRIDECAPDITIRPWTISEIQRAQRARREIWTSLLPGEALEYRSIDDLLERYARAANHRLRDSDGAIHDRWDGTRSQVAYEYVVHPQAPA